MSKYGIMFMCATQADVVRLIGLAEQAGIGAVAGSPTPMPGNPPGPPPAPPVGLPAAPAIVPPPAPPPAIPSAPAPAPSVAPAVSPSDQQQMVEAMGAYIKQHGPEMAMKAFALYQCPQNLGTATPQQFATMLAVFRSMQPMP